MPSQMILDHQRHAAVLLATLKQHAKTATGLFTRRVKPYLRDGEQLPDLVVLYELLDRRLAGLRRQLAEVDASLAHLPDESEEAFHARATRYALRVEHDEACLAGVRVLESLYRHAGTSAPHERPRPSPTARRLPASPP